jgi:hypothetical protein
MSTVNFGHSNTRIALARMNSGAANAEANDQGVRVRGGGSAIAPSEGAPMKRKGPMSMQQHRDWVAMHEDWEPQDRRPRKEVVRLTMQRLAGALGESEAQLVNAVIARADYTLPEIARVEEWARQALTIVSCAADQAAWTGRDSPTTCSSTNSRRDSPRRTARHWRLHPHAFPPR